MHIWAPSQATSKKRPTIVRVPRTIEIARTFLKEHGPSKPPVDTYAILRNLSEVVEIELEDEGAEDARTVAHPGGYVTVLNVSRNIYRIRFTCGHETAHIVLDHFEEFDVDSLTEPERRILDREADIFAREILMPEDWVREYANPPCSAQQLGKLKGLFGVSWDALLRRLDELGLQSESVSRIYLREYAILKSFDLPLHMLPQNPLVRLASTSYLIPTPTAGCRPR
ncbi:MAG: ImmA/IrrE family metallo-endopeptidase [Thermodesulfobacteriota bacterium]